DVASRVEPRGHRTCSLAAPTLGEVKAANGGRVGLPRLRVPAVTRKPMMRICRLKIYGYRGANKADVRFGEHSVLAGQTIVVRLLSSKHSRSCPVAIGW